MTKNRKVKDIISLILSICMVVILIPKGEVQIYADANDNLDNFQEINLSNAKLIDVSSEHIIGNAKYMIDGDLETRWESERGVDPQYFTIALGSVKKIYGIQLFWEAAASKSYMIQISKDNLNWTTVFTQTNGNGGTETIKFSRGYDVSYIKLYSYERTTTYGVSLYEVKILGEDDNQIPNGAKYYNGHYYYIYNVSGYTWDKAKSYCESLGGHLATITSSEEQIFIEKLNSTNLKLWIGAYRDDYFNWYWVTNEKWDYINWEDGEPNNSTNVITNEKCVAIWPQKWNDLNSSSEEQEGYICEWDTSQPEIDEETSGTVVIPGKETHYGLASTEKSEEQLVKEAANELVKAENEYISAINSTVKTGINTSNTVDAIKEKDQSGKNHILTLDPNAPDDAVYAGYVALAEFFEEYKETTPSIGEIDISANIISIEAKIINTLRTQSLRYVNVQTKYGKYTAKITGTFALGAFSCGINVSGNGHTYTGLVNSKIDDTKKVMASYIKALGDAGEDVSKQGLRAYLKDFARYTCISDFTQETMNDALTNIADYLQSKNWGKKVLEYGVRLYDGYDLVKNIVKAENDKGLANSLSNAENIYKKIKSMSYTDASVKDKAIKYTTDKIEKSRKNLEEALWNYIYHTKSEDGTLSFWDKVKGKYKEITGHCPVDFVVYDENGKIVGRACDGYCEYEDSIYIEVSDDVKTIYVPSDMNVQIEMTGTDVGTMTYVVEQYENNIPVGRVNYYDIPLTNGSTYTQIISSGDISKDAGKNIITADDGTDIKANEYISADDSALVDISCTTRGQGNVLGTGSYAKGDAVELVASPDEGYYFDGWYDGETLVGIDAIYRFPAINDKEIKAVFSKKNKLTQTINCESSYSVSVNDKPFNLNASADSNQLYFSSADDGVVKVDDNGNVSIVGAGITQIYVLAVATEDYDVAVKTIDIMVSETSTEETTNLEEMTSDNKNQDTRGRVITNNKVIKIKKIKKAKKSLKITWKKAKGVSGYQIQYSTSSKFKKAKKITIKKAKITSKTIKKLKAKKKYYVRIRTYMIVNGTKKYSAWSKKKSQKTK